MSEASHNPMDLSGLLAEATAAERAGVFEPTRLDVSALMADHKTVSGQTGSGLGLVGIGRRPRWLAVYEKALVGLPLAACVGIVIGLASLSAHVNTGGGSLAMLNTNGSAATASPVCDVSRLAQCLSGPGHPVSGECLCVDLDQDGDVDLSDMSSYQRLASALP